MKPTRIALAVLAALAVLVAAGCGDDEQKVPTNAVAVVDGTPVTKAELDSLLARAKATYKSQKRAFPKAGTWVFRLSSEGGSQLFVNDKSTVYNWDGAFPSVKELSFKASATVRGTNPYALVAFELEGQADGGAVEGRYLELGAAPGFSLAGMAVAVPVKVGLSLDGYYEGLRGDERFGFFSIGGSLTVPLSSERSRFGRWNAHGGVDYVRLGDSNALRLGDNTKVIISAGIGLSY